MVDFFEIDEAKKTIKILNLDNFSVDELKTYIKELNAEIERVKLEIIKKDSVKKKAEDYFK